MSCFTAATNGSCSASLRTSHWGRSLHHSLLSTSHYTTCPHVSSLLTLLRLTAAVRTKPNFCFHNFKSFFVVVKTRSYPFLHPIPFSVVCHYSLPLPHLTSKIIEPNLSASQTISELWIVYWTVILWQIIFGVPLWHSPTPTWFRILKKDFDYFHFGSQEICHAKFRGSSFNSIGVNRIQTNRQTDKHSEIYSR